MRRFLSRRERAVALPAASASSAHASHVEVQVPEAVPPAAPTPVPLPEPPPDIPSQIAMLAVRHASLGQHALEIEPPDGAKRESLRFVQDLYDFVQSPEPERPVTASPVPVIAEAGGSSDRRNEIVAALGTGPRSIAELSEQIGMAASTLRRWLRVLEAEQIVRRSIREDARSGSWELVP